MNQAARKTNETLDSAIAREFSRIGVVNATAEVIDGKTIPVTSSPVLAGSESAHLDSAAAYRAFVLETMAEAPTEATDGKSRMIRLFQSWQANDKQTIEDGLNLKDSGFEQGSTGYVSLSIVRGLYKLYAKQVTGAAEILTAERVSYVNKAGEKVESGSFKARTIVARNLYALWQEKQAAKAIKATAYAEARTILEQENPDVDVETIIAAAEQREEEMLAKAEREADEQQEKDDSADGRAYRYAKAMYRATKGDYNFCRDIIDAMRGALDKVEAEALAKQAKLDKAKLDAAK